MSRAARDIRFDEVLATACYEDRNKYCQGVQPGSARVIRCLGEHRGTLKEKCSAALFDHEVRLKHAQRAAESTVFSRFHA